jgi:polyhydroxyalkanoate synthesis regulator phasin
MDKSLQQILDSIFDSVARESEAASSRVRDGVQSLLQRIEPPREEIARLKARVDALEAEVAELKAKHAPG